MHNKIKGRGIVFLLLLTTATYAQQIDYGLSAGFGVLSPKIRYENTDLVSYLEDKNIQLSDYKKSLKRFIFAPSFGVNAEAYYETFPAFLRAEVSTSKSALQYLSASIEAGFGEDFALSGGYQFVTLKIGYKLVYDKGFGRPTILNSLKSANDQMAAMPMIRKKNALHRNSGKIIPIKVGIGHLFDSGVKIGAMLQVDVDITSVVNTARMHSASIGVYVKRGTTPKKLYKNDL
jgi:hypothetical protein